MICIILIQNETEINNSMELQNLLGKVKNICIASPIVADPFWFFFQGVVEETKKLSFLNTRSKVVCTMSPQQVICSDPPLLN